MAGRRRRGWTGLIVGVAILITALWVGYWFAARYVAEAGLARAAFTGLACADPRLAGFPLAVEVRCARLTYADGNDRMTAAIGGVAASAPLYRPGTVEARIDAPFVVNAPAMGVALSAAWSLGNASLSAWLGGLTGLGASFVSLTAENNGTLPGLPFNSLAAADAAARIAPAGDGAYTVTLDARQLKLTRATGSLLPDLDSEARVTLLGVGDTLGTDPAHTILTWARNGPSARIERLRIAGVGAVVTSEGNLGLSDDGRLNGSILLRWNDIARLADLIEAIFPGTRERAETPLQGLNAVSVPVETDDGPMRQTTLTFTNGVIWLGIFPLPIDPIPPLRF
jgi:hypothetical protein